MYSFVKTQQMYTKDRSLLHHVALSSYHYSHNCLQFVAAGGLQQLLEIFNSGILEPKEQESWTVVSENSHFQQVTVVTPVSHFHEPLASVTFAANFILVKESVEYGRNKFKKK